MKKSIGMLIACIFFAAVVYAEEPKKEAVSLWDKIRNKIEKITPKQKPTVTTAVGGVRGAQNSEGHELYWKGEEGRQGISAEEVDLFSSALQMAEAGAGVGASAAFQEFLEKFPDSTLGGDAKSALAELAKEQVAPQVPQDFSPPQLPDFKLGM